MSPRLGCIADDHTGGSDVAAALRRAGLRTVLRFGTPPDGTGVPDCDAVVVALTTRTAAPADAVARSLVARRWLAGLGIRRFYVKYCSTFDSTDRGNIGPVVDAVADDLADDLAGGPVPVCPASPEHGRRSFLGHLFVGDVLLSESSMRDHPLTPMRDPDIVRVLGRQTPRLVGLLALPTIHSGPDAIRGRFEEAAADGVRHVVVDAVGDTDLAAVAHGARHLPLLTGGAGLAAAMARVDVCGEAPDAAPVALPAGPGIVLVGSCSTTTSVQLDRALARFPGYRIDPVRVPDPDALVERACAWMSRQATFPVVIHTSAPPPEREAARAALGPDASTILERVLGRVARHAATLGVRRFVVAGGETSGAVTSALGVDQVLVGQEADRGVPWCVTTGDDPLALLLKSGNFGGPDLLVRALDGVAA